MIVVEYVDIYVLTLEGCLRIPSLLPPRFSDVETKSKICKLPGYSGYFTDTKT